MKGANLDCLSSIYTLPHFFRIVPTWILMISSRKIGFVGPWVVKIKFYWHSQGKKVTAQVICNIIRREISGAGKIERQVYTIPTSLNSKREISCHFMSLLVLEDFWDGGLLFGMKNIKWKHSGIEIKHSNISLNTFVPRNLQQVPVNWETNG